MRPVVFLHVPKCGGSSFGAALRLRAFYSQTAIDIGRTRTEALTAQPSLSGDALIRADYARRQVHLAAALARRTRAIAAHACYAAALHQGPGAGHLWITLLRDPVARFVSHYHYLQRCHPDPARPASLEAFCETPGALRIGSQCLFYFSGDWLRPEVDPAAQIATARRALGQLDLVGRLEDARGFRQALSRLVGSPLPWLHRNRAPEAPTLNPILRRRIERCTAADLELYESVFAPRAAA